MAIEQKCKELGEILISYILTMRILPFCLQYNFLNKNGNVIPVISVLYSMYVVKACNLGSNQNTTHISCSACTCIPVTSGLSTV